MIGYGSREVSNENHGNAVCLSRWTPNLERIRRMKAAWVFGMRLFVLEMNSIRRKLFHSKSGIDY